MHPFRILPIGCGLMLAMVFSSCLRAQSIPDFAARSEAAAQAVAASGFDGVAGWVVPGESAYYRKFGRAEDLPQAAEKTQVDIGSISKTVTAAAIMHLLDAGALDLNQTLSEFFPDVPAEKSEISLHQLLTHSAGFRESLGRDSQRLARNDFLEKALASRLRFEPGSSYSYSNVGYSLLAAVLETVSGQEYQDYLLQELFQQESFQQELLPGTGSPRIGYSEVYAEEHSLRDRRGRGVARVSWGRDEAWWNLVGNGGLVASVEDMLEFFTRLLDGELISPTSLELLLTPHVREVPDNTHYGYGLVVASNSSWGDYVWHNGGNGTFNARWTYIEESGLLVFAAGVRNPDADDAARLVVNGLLR